MVFRDKTPVSRIQRIVPVVSHHEIVVLSESIAASLFPVYEDAPVLGHIDVIALVDIDNPLVQRKIIWSQLYCRAFFRNPYRPVIVPRPSEILVKGEERKIRIRIIRRVDIYVLLHRHDIRVFFLYTDD